MEVFAQVPDVVGNHHKVDELHTIVNVIFGLMRQELLNEQSKQIEAMVPVNTAIKIKYLGEGFFYLLDLKNSAFKKEIAKKG